MQAPLHKRCRRCNHPAALQAPQCEKCGHAFSTRFDAAGNPLPAEMPTQAFPQPFHAPPPAPARRGPSRNGKRDAILGTLAATVVVAVLAILGSLLPPAEPSAPPAPEPSYLQHASEVQIGMTTDQVRQICGPPDHIQTFNSIGQLPEEYWYYDRRQAQLIFKIKRLHGVNTY